MKKFLSLMIILSLSAVLCITSCDQEQGGSGSSGSGSGGEVGGNEQIAITSFSIEPDENIKMVVDTTKDFVVSWTPTNANVFDLTWDVSGDLDILSVDTASISTDGKIIVTAVKVGTANITVSRIGNPSVNKTLNITVIDAVVPEEGEPADITTVAVKINVTDVTMDDIFMSYVKWDTGTYDKDDAIFGHTSTIQKDQMTIDKTDSKSGTVNFIIEDEGLSDGFTPYYDIKLVNSKKKTIGNLNINQLNVYQETRVYKSKNKYYIEVYINGVYGDAALELN